jgi:exosortase/archaeosortase family protein
MVTEKKMRWAVKIDEPETKKEKEFSEFLDKYTKNYFWIEKREAFFILKFFAIFLILELALHIIGFEQLQNMIAKSQAKVFNLVSEGNNIFLDAGVFEINPSCTGLVSGIILAAIIFSLKKPDLPKKIFILISGSLVLFVINYFRVLIVIWAGIEFGMQAAEAVHVVSWFSTTFFVFGAWYYFTKLVSGAKNFDDFI